MLKSPSISFRFRCALCYPRCIYSHLIPLPTLTICLRFDHSKILNSRSNSYNTNCSTSSYIPSSPLPLHIHLPLPHPNPPPPPLPALPLLRHHHLQTPPLSLPLPNCPLPHPHLPLRNSNRSSSTQSNHSRLMSKRSINWRTSLSNRKKSRKRSRF